MRMQGLRRNTRPTSVLIDYLPFTDIPIEWNSMLNQLDQLGFDGLEVHVLLRRCLSLLTLLGHLSSFEVPFMFFKMFVNGSRRKV